MAEENENVFEKELAFVCKILLYGSTNLIQYLPENSELLKHPSIVFSDEFAKESSSKNENYLFDLRLPLFFAIQSRSLEAVTFVVERKADIRFTRPWGLPGITLATYLNLPEIVSFFLAKGADPNFADNLNATDRYFQNENCPPKHKELWRKYHHEVHQGFGQFYPPLLIAAKYPKILKILLSNPETDVNIGFQSTCETALHVAARLCSLPAVKLLLEKSFPNNCNLFGQTPLDLACETCISKEVSHEKLNALTLMLEYGCKFSCPRYLFSFRAHNGRRGLSRICAVLWIVLCVPYKYLFLKFQNMTLKQFVIEVIENLRNEYYRLLQYEKQRTPFSSSDASSSEDDTETPIPYVGSVLRNLIHLLYCRGSFPFDAKELKFIFEDDLLSHPDKATIEYEFLKSVIANPLSLKFICRNTMFNTGFLCKDIPALKLSEKLKSFLSL